MKRIAFLRNITVEPITESLKEQMPAETFEFYFSGYADMYQEVMLESSRLFEFKPDMVLTFLDLRIQSPKLTYEFAGLSEDEIREQVREIVVFVDEIIKRLRQNTNAMVLFHSFDEVVFPNYGIYDYQRRDNQLNTIRQLNLELVDVVTKYPNTFIVDMPTIQARLGHKSYFDPRYWNIARAPYGREVYAELSKEYAKFMKAARGESKKCIVLDCDNTLWGGIIGEDGIDKIRIGNSYPGSAYLNFQRVIRDYYNSGILLAICSKNNEQDVLEVLERHPDMLLRKEQFVTWRINWTDKATNLKEIANELNIGLDSLVFVDDSAFEIELVKKELPVVGTILLNGDPVTYAETLQSCGLFDRLSITEEDRKKSKMYLAEKARQESFLQTSNLEEFYRSLEMELLISRADDYSIPRIAQLTQKTNQFNLTTKRYSEADINRFVNSKDYDVFYARLKDKFGDNGIVGVAILEYAGDNCVIDSFLLSCRIIGRGIEGLFLRECVRRAKQRGLKKIMGVFIPTRKNAQVQHFYSDNGFESQGNDRDEYAFSLDLSSYALNSDGAYLKKLEVKI